MLHDMLYDIMNIVYLMSASQINFTLFTTHNDASTLQYFKNFIQKEAKPTSFLLHTKESTNKRNGTMRM